MNSVFISLKKYKHLLLLIYWPFHFMWYEIVRIYSDKMPNFYIVKSPLDDLIPFCEFFVLPYATWYFYIMTVLIYFAYKNKRDFLKANSMIIGCMFISMLITTIFPSGIPESMRPDFVALGRDNFLIDAVKYIYSIDSPPRNVMPSMHVNVSAALFISVLKAESLKGKKFIKLCSFTLSLLIILSIVFIKQHSVLDGIAGLALAGVMYLVTYNWFFKEKKTL
ncbi:MAG: hypothetical protein A2Y15_03330 [Clostridiales bacterium GWF2_36_10]|nr:MAG: hypothetical protein A2Y15_03330 [Clostridiales bacterium GWF2_36_10]HAN20150.1 hypothetical protein [Clostridiales bacterium]